MSSSPTDPNDDIIISGMSGQFPNSLNAKEYIDQLLKKVDLCTEDYLHFQERHPELPKRGGRLVDVESWDAGHFGFHGLQASYTDPMRRILLEQVYQAIFDAGIHPDELIGTNTAVFIGGSSSEYELCFKKKIRRNSNIIAGVTRSMNAHNISYSLQLNGPSSTCDTACSSGMYALDAAYRAIKEGRCDRAIVGASNMCLSIYCTLQFVRLGVLNTEGSCRPFDNKANGYTRSEGIAAIVMQKLPEAKRVYAKLVHSKSNADGFKITGITFPSYEGQTNVLTDVYNEAGVDPKDIGFLEAHGTGTKVGDPEELLVIDDFFKPTIDAPLMIGSVKGNIGHSEPSAGLCSIIKVLSALYTGKIAPNIHYDTPREGVAALKENRLRVVTEVTPFPEDKKYAGVNCFGFGGANAHAILEKYTKINPELSQLVDCRLVCYSGRTQSALDAIHEAIINCNNLEYIALLEESFKKHIDSHLYRGFTITGIGLRSFTKSDFPEKEKLMAILGDFHLNKCNWFSKVPLIENALNKCDTPNDIIVILKIFKNLNLSLDFFSNDHISTAIKMYFKDQLSESQVNNIFSTNVEPPSAKIVERWIQTISVYSNKGTIICLGNTSLDLEKLSKTCNVVKFDNDLSLYKFLYNLGRLYELGYQPAIHKLYPPATYPVSSGTNMLSHVLKWKHKTYKLLNWQREHLKMEFYEYIGNIKEHAFFKGHLINNKNLFPATGYLERVWYLFTIEIEVFSTNVGVIFENVQFHRACTLTDEKRLELYIAFDHMGNFEVTENDSLVVSGSIKIYDEDSEANEMFISEEQEKPDTSEDGYVLSSKDAYRELRLRGYNYGGMFRAIHEVTPSVSTIKWDNNWITFLDNMMQVCILQQDTRSLYVPVGIDYLAIRSVEHTNYHNSQENKLVPVRLFKDSNTIRSRYVEMKGLSARSIAQRKNRQKPVLECYQFVPNEFTTDLATSVRINIQLLLECKPTINFKATELLEDNEGADNSVSPIICDAIEDLPVVLPDMTILSQIGSLQVPNCKTVQEMTEPNVLLVCKNPTKTIFEQIEKIIMPDGFVMIFASEKVMIPESYNILTIHILKPTSTKENTMQFPPKVYFIRKRLPKVTKTIINISDTSDLNWLQDVQDSMKSYQEVILLAQNSNKSGILGFTNCLNREPGCNKTTCIFIQDKSLCYDKNNNNENIYKQLKKQMRINVYNDGQWGTYRHLLLADIDKISAHHWYGKTLIPGDLSTLSWVQGPIRPDQGATIKIMFAALNFRDLMVASGKLPVNTITKSRLLQELSQGFEYAGIDTNGKRVLAMGSCGLSNMSRNGVLLLNIPDEIDIEDAATIFVVYTTVMYGLIYKANLQRGQTILIHSGTGGIGLAALNICTYFNCNIFVTVGTKEKLAYLREHYPHIKPSHIGNSRNTSFKQMVIKETNGVGVDLVLNSLAEEKLQASIECLAHGGSFIEIGKYDLDKNNKISVELAMKECNLISCMLDKYLDENKSSMVLTKLWKDALKEGYVKPLPRTVFEMNELDKSFKYMSTGKHIGKILIRIDHEKDHSVLPRYHCDPSKSYIIVGGLGGFGLELADWLVLRGAKHIILSSRTGVTTGYQRYRIATWKTYGVKITILLENLIIYDTCYNALKKIQQKIPIDGIFNLAVVLEDSIFEHQTLNKMKTSMEPKAILTGHLDKITKELCPNLRTFVVFSSVSCGRGNAGQTNYGYSNSVMERICEMRHAAGYPALAVQWGAVGDVGILEILQKEHNEIAIGGTLQQKIGSCLEVFDKLLLQKNPIVSSIVVAEKFNKGTANSPIEAVCKILGVQNVMKTVSAHTTFPELGMDSMMAVEIKQTLERDFEIILTPNDLRTLTFPKLEEMSSKVAEKSIETVTADTIKLIMTIPCVELSLNKNTIIDLNKDKSRKPGDFIVAFLGIDTDIKSFEVIANKIKYHMKVVNYDAITNQQENVDVIVEHVYNVVKEDITSLQTFKIMAHSIGNLGAIELCRKLENENIKGKLILLDGAPELSYQLIDAALVNGQDDFDHLVIESFINAILPNENLIELRKKLLKGKNFGERVDIVIAAYLDPADKIRNKQMKNLMQSFHSRLMSVISYKTRPQNAKIKSDVILYRPITALVKNIANDYKLREICKKPVNLETFEGNHLSMLQNEKLIEHLAQKLKTN